jgi:hypothetical protein
MLQFHKVKDKPRIIFRFFTSKDVYFFGPIHVESCFACCRAMLAVEKGGGK